MLKHSLPIKRLDGSVFIEPLRPDPAGFADFPPRSRRRRDAVNNTEVQREKIFRDIAILVLLAVTIIAGSAVLVGMLWRDVAIADSQARIVEAEQAASARLAEAEILAASEEKQFQDDLQVILIGLGLAIVLLVLIRPIAGR